MLAMHEIQALSENFTSLKWFEHKNCFLSDMMKQNLSSLHLCILGVNNIGVNNVLERFFLKRMW